MREDKWRKEDQARLNLLKNVYDNRAQNIELKQKQKAEQEWLKDYENKKIQEEVERQERAYQEKIAKEALQRKQHQGDILMQMNERDRNNRRLIQEKMYEERAAKIAEMQYTKKIQDQKMENRVTLNNMRSTL